MSVFVTPYATILLLFIGLQSLIDANLMCRERLWLERLGA
jgi:hypothetical protein